MNFNDIKCEQELLPYGGGTVYNVYTYNDPVLDGYQVVTIADTVNKKGSRLITDVWRFPRVILSEINTHRVFSRNSASSRARSVLSTFESVMQDPYIPLFTSNQRGMSGEFIENVDALDEATQIYLDARDDAVKNGLKLLLGSEAVDSIENPVAQYEELLNYYHKECYLGEEYALNVHKQNVNRLLEPFMWHEAVISSSSWDNFYHLRDDLEKAYPEIYAIAHLARYAHEHNRPVEREYHLPFVPDSALTGVWEDDYSVLMDSSSNAAQISYYDKSAKNSKVGSSSLGERLLKSEHYSPFEHCAYSDSMFEKLGLDKDKDYSGNFDNTWLQLRHILADKK